jgi:hypothetical protein
MSAVSAAGTETGDPPSAFSATLADVDGVCFAAV